jgi:hypothetical protein
VEFFEGSEHLLPESAVPEESIHFPEVTITRVLPATSSERMAAKSFKAEATKDFVKVSDCWQRSKRDKARELVCSFVQIFFGTVSCLSKKYREISRTFLQHREAEHNFRIAW